MFLAERMEANLQAETKQNAILNAQVAQLKQDIMLATKRQSMAGAKVRSTGEDQQAKEEEKASLEPGDNGEGNSNSVHFNALQLQYDEEKKAAQALQEELRSTRAKMAKMAELVDTGEIDESSLQETKKTMRTLQTQESIAKKRLSEANKKASGIADLRDEFNDQARELATLRDRLQELNRKLFAVTSEKEVQTKKVEKLEDALRRKGERRSRLQAQVDALRRSPGERAPQGKVDALAREGAATRQRRAKEERVRVVESDWSVGEVEVTLEGDRTSQGTIDTSNAYEKAWFPYLCNDAISEDVSGESQSETNIGAWFNGASTANDNYVTDEEESRRTLNTNGSRSITKNTTFSGERDTVASSCSDTWDTRSSRRNTLDKEDTLSDHDAGKLQGAVVGKSASTALATMNATAASERSRLGSMMIWFSRDKTVDCMPEQGTMIEGGRAPARQ